MNMNVNWTRHIIFIYIVKASNMGSEFQRRWVCYDLTKWERSSKWWQCEWGKMYGKWWFFDHQSFFVVLFRFSEIFCGWLRCFLHQLLDVSSHYYPMIPPSSPVANCVRSKMFHQVLALRLPLRKMCRQLRDVFFLEEFFLLGNPLGEVVFWVFPLTLW